MPLKVLVTGSTGLIGSEVTAFLTGSGHHVLRLVRRKPAGDEIQWDPETGAMDLAALEGLDAVVHLAGESIMGKWTPEKKARIHHSRVGGTRFLSESLARLNHPPGVLVCSSALGYYGNRGDEILTEESPKGSGFLSDVCLDWEAAPAPAREKGIRTASLRTAMVLSPRGGALAAMLRPFQLGIAGKLGSGKQYMSWITLDDMVAVIHHAIRTDSLTGPINACSPNPVTNSEFTRTLGRVISRPNVLPAPAFALRLAFGETADEMLLSSIRAKPVKLLETGYIFKDPDLDFGLRRLLGK